jgi:hypothetical protein
VGRAADARRRRWGYVHDTAGRFDDLDGDEWRCPHPASESDRCVFHANPGGVPAADRRDALLDAVADATPGDRVPAAVDWLANAAVDATCGYGERPSRTVTASALAIAGFAVAFERFVGAFTIALFVFALTRPSSGSSGLRAGVQPTADNVRSGGRHGRPNSSAWMAVVSCSPSL